MSRRPWIAAVTDDGATAEGYFHLLRALFSRCWHIEAFAPELSWTSFGTAVGLETFSVENAQPVRRLPLQEAPAEFKIKVYDLPPAAISRIACAWAAQAGMVRFFNSCIVAGVNHGPNVGEGLIHSGTFGAALVAFWLGQAAVAVSLDDVYSVEETNPGPLRFATAARIAVAAVEWVLSQPHPILCNINVPNVCVSATDTFEPSRPQGQAFAALPLRTDIEVLRDGYVSVTGFPTGSIESVASLSEAAAFGIAGFYGRQELSTN